MSNHTPGPWTYEYDDSGFFCIEAANMPSPYICATGNTGPVNAANAKLIAAAPDMLTLLTSIQKEGELSAGNDEAISELLKSLE